MYPYPILAFYDFKLGLYELCMLAGFILAVVILRVLADREALSPAVQNLAIFGGFFSFAIGYFTAVLTQAFYNFMDSGIFTLEQQTGATFYGGLLGGAAIFLLIYLGIGHFVCRERENTRAFWRVANFAAIGIAAAHGCGRIGCLMAGCCYGKETDSVFGLVMAGTQRKVIPVQLYEALFLLGLAVFLFVRAWKGKGYALALYMSTYGIWRIFAEMLRDDHRGQTVVPYLTPSQLTALVLICGAVAVYLGERASRRKHEVPHDPT